MTATMDQMKVIWIKEETNNVLPDPESVTLEDPLKIEELSLHIKEDTEMKGELKVCGDVSGHNTLQDPLKIEELNLHVKQDPELEVYGDGSGDYMVASTTCALGSTRLIKNSVECHGISFEETVNHGVINDGLNKDAQESTHYIMFGTCTKGLTSQDEMCVVDEALSADNKKNFHCSDSQKNIRFSEDLEASFVEQVERQSSSQETCIASQESFSVIYNTQTVLHRAVTSDRDNYLLSLKKYNVNAQPGRNTLKRHSLVHSEITPHQCDNCGKSFTSSDTLRQHALLHSDIKPHKCDTCGESFTRSDKLKKHALLHSGIKPHKCDTCGKCFTELSTLKSHALIHSGIKLHKCDTCGKSFTKSNVLKKHALIHSGIKAHKCDTCGKSFTRLDHLKQHALLHSGIKAHKCDSCGKSFTRLDSLRHHTLLHFGIKAHKCDICAKSFTRSFTLRQHTLLHSEIRPHKCDICGESFTRSDKLKQHACYILE